jgi:hypothetical protein
MYGRVAFRGYSEQGMKPGSAGRGSKEYLQFPSRIRGGGGLQHISLQMIYRLYGLFSENDA